MIGIDLVALEGASAAAVGTTVDVVAAANRLLGQPDFDLRMVAPGRRVALRGGLGASAVAFSSSAPRDVVIIAGLGAADSREIDSRLTGADISATGRWLRNARPQTQIAASCTGVFVVGAAGLLDHRRCVTTWWLGSDLTRIAPHAHLVIDEMVVRDGPIWTAGSSFAHIDLMLALMRHLGGTQLAEELASRLLIDQRTSQAAFLIPSHLAARDDTIAAIESHVRQHLTDVHTLSSLAHAAGTSSRTLARKTANAVGLSPLQLVARIRLQRALHQLRTTRMPLDAIAAAVGLGDPATLHRLIKKHTGHSPGALRPASPRH